LENIKSMLSEPIYNTVQKTIPFGLTRFTLNLMNNPDPYFDSVMYKQLCILHIMLQIHFYY